MVLNIPILYRTWGGERLECRVDGATHTQIVQITPIHTTQSSRSSFFSHSFGSAFEKNGLVVTQVLRTDIYWCAQSRVDSMCMDIYSTGVSTQELQLFARISVGMSSQDVCCAVWSSGELARNWRYAILIVWHDIDVNTYFSIGQFVL